MPETIMEYFGDGQKHGVNITYVHEPEPLGTGGALGLLPDATCNELPLILINGDILTTLDFSNLLNFSRIDISNLTNPFSRTSRIDHLVKVYSSINVPSFKDVETFFVKVHKS